MSASDAYHKVGANRQGIDQILLQDATGTMAMLAFEALGLDEIKADIAVDFPRPREVYKLKMLPEYSRLAFCIWEYLREEVMKATVTMNGA